MNKDAQKGISLIMKSFIQKLLTRYTAATRPPIWRR